jgi:SAM-dependent methyltransferase
MGDTGFVAAALIGAEGGIISSNFAPVMVEGARRRAEELGIANVDFRVIDAENIDWASESVDGVICRWGYMLVSNPGAALKETRRVLKSGGRLGLSVFSGPEQNPWAALPAKALVAGGFMEAPAPGSPGIPALGDKERLKSLLTEAGFTEQLIEEVPITWRQRDLEDYWRFLTEVAGAIAALIESLPPEGQEKAKESIRRAVSSFQTESEIASPGVTLNVLARELSICDSDFESASVQNRLRHL